MNAKQEKTLAALLSEPTYEKAAAKSGVSESTIIRYLKEPEFKEAYRDGRREMVGLAITQLQLAASDAVQTLKDIASDTEAKDSSRVSAAKTILETAFRAVEIEDLAVRLESLEEALKANGNN